MEDELSTFRKDGCALFKHVFTRDELEPCRPPMFTADEVSALPTEFRKRVAFAHPVGNAGDIDTKVPNKIEQSRELPDPIGPRLWNLANDARLRDIARRLLEVDGVEDDVVIMKDKFVYKMKGGAGFTPHQDDVYAYHRIAKRTVSLQVSFDAAMAHNSPLEIVRGVQNVGLVIADRTERELPAEFVSKLKWEEVHSEPGDVFAFDGRVPHRSEPNESDDPRAMYYVTFARKSDCVENPYDSYYKYYWRWTDPSVGNFTPGWDDDGAFPSLVETIHYEEALLKI